MSEPVDDNSIDYGTKAATRLFAQRGNHSEMHIDKATLAAYLALAFHYGRRIAQ